MSVMSQSGRWMFNAATVTATTYVYTAAGGNNATAGLFPMKADSTVVQYGCATLNATTLYLRIEGKFSPLDRWAEVYSTSVTSASVDQLVNISESLSDIRMGVKVSNSATPNIFYGGLVLTELK